MSESLDNSCVTWASYLIPSLEIGGRHSVSIPGSERSPGGGRENPLQYSCLENPMDSDACQATVHRVAKCRTELSD